MPRLPTQSGRGFLAPPPAPPSPLEWLTGQGLCPKPAAGAGDTPSPSQGAWASGATPKIAQLSGPQIRLQPPCPDGAPGRAGSASPSHCLHLLPVTAALEPRLKSQPPSGGHSLSGGRRDGSDGTGVFGCQTPGRNAEGVPRDRNDLRALLLPWICCAVWKRHSPSLNLSLPVCKMQ